MTVFIPTDRETAEWRNESTQKPPQRAVYLHECGAAAVLKQAYADTATVWTGDFHNAKQVLAAVQKRVRKPTARQAEI
ncbi:methyltransferase, partial [Bacillus stratosphericus]